MLPMIRLIFGRWTRSTSNNMVPDVECGLRPSAKLHVQWRQNCSDKFAHLFLPPYSPELNPIERVWKLTRRMATHNRYFEKIEHVANAVETQFNLWSKPNNTLKRLCAII
jgi:transposase